MEKIYTLGIDVGSSGAALLISRLGKLKSTIDISYGGAYHQDTKYSQVWVKTTMTGDELEDWLYTTKFPRYFDIVGVFDKEW